MEKNTIFDWAVPITKKTCREYESDPDMMRCKIKMAMRHINSRIKLFGYVSFEDILLQLRICKDKDGPFSIDEIENTAFYRSNNVEKDEYLGYDFSARPDGMYIVKFYEL